MTIRNNPYIRFGVIIGCFVVSFGLVRSLITNWSKGDLVRERQAVLQKEQKRNVTLREKLEEATSAAFVEKEARNKLGLAKEGETIVLVGTPTLGDRQPQGFQGASLSRWQQWWRLFF